MSLDWIHSSLKSGEADVYCKECEMECEFDGWSKTYLCECRFGASIEALAFGLEGYSVEY